MISASEDIGNADPQGLLIATAAFQATETIGMPECRITLAQATTYLACAPKSNAAYKAIEAALLDVRTNSVLPVPMHLRDGHYKGAKNWDTAWVINTLTIQTKDGWNRIIWAFQDSTTNLSHEDTKCNSASGSTSSEISSGRRRTTTIHKGSLDSPI